MKYEFDTWDELREAMDHLEDYHDCEKCNGKMVFISVDFFGNTMCGYCDKMVRYPTMKKEAFEKMIKNVTKKNAT